MVGIEGTRGLVHYDESSHGAHGWISGIPSMVPGAAKRLYEAIAVRGDLPAAREHWERLAPLMRPQFGLYHSMAEGPQWLSVMKAGLNMIGPSVGEACPPIQPLPAKSLIRSRRCSICRAVVVRPGRDVTIVALGRMVHLARAVGDDLEQEGTSVEVIDPRTVSPFDSETILASVHKTGRLLIVDESPAQFGFGAEIAAQVAAEGFDDLDAPIRRLTGAFCPTPCSPPLEIAVVPDSERIAAAFLRDFRLALENPAPYLLGL